MIFFESIQQTLIANWSLLWSATLDTLRMLGISWGLTVLIGLPLGIMLFLTSPRQILEERFFYLPLSIMANIIRSFPFLILIVVLIPLTRLVVGSTYGVKGVIFPLVIGSAPFFARLAESALKEVDKGVIEAALSMGTPLHKIITRVLLPESLPALINAITVTGIIVLSYTAMAGVVGGGGLGDLAIRFGYHRQQTELMYIVVIILIIIVQIIQITGDYLALRLSRK